MFFTDFNIKIVNKKHDCSWHTQNNVDEAIEPRQKRYELSNGYCMFFNQGTWLGIHLSHVVGLCPMSD